jgi:hypothetical protein
MWGWDVITFINDDMWSSVFSEVGRRNFWRCQNFWCGSWESELPIFIRTFDIPCPNLVVPRFDMISSSRGKLGYCILGRFYAGIRPPLLYILEDHNWLRYPMHNRSFIKLCLPFILPNSMSSICSYFFHLILFGSWNIQYKITKCWYKIKR